MKKVKNRVLSSRIIATVLTGAVLSVYAAPVWAAEPTGGKWITFGGGNCYVGIDTSGSNLTLDDNREDDDFYGGYVNGTVTDNVVADNTVTVTGNGSAYTVYGGIVYNADTCEVKRNHVIIKSGANVVNVYGGATSGSGNVEDNTVTADGANLKTLTGGMASGGGNAVRNIVTLNDTNVTENVTGGKTFKNGKANYNEIIISGNSELSFFVFGGSCAGDGEASYNKVTMSGGSVNQSIYGGYSSKNATVTDNNVIMSGGTVNNNVIGGYSAGSGASNNNSVIMSGGTVNNNVIGGSNDGSGGASNNSVIISGNSAVSNTVYGAWTTKTDVVAEGNSVTISENSTVKKVVGGYSQYGIASNNTAEILGGTVTSSVTGGEASKDAVDNNIKISGGTIKSTVYGGNGDNSATGNTVLINGGLLSGASIFGGYSYKGNATGNTVTITNASGKIPEFGKSTTIYGGKSGGNGKDVVTGNTLNLHTKGLEAKNVMNFENYNFYLQEDTINGDTILTLTNAGGTDISGSNVNVGLEGSASALQSGDKVSLLTNANGINAVGVTYGKLQQGVSIEYEFITGLSADGKSIVATVAGGDSGKTTEQAKSPVETQIAAAAFVNSGADTVAGSGITNAVQVAGGGSAEMFGASGGGNMRYKSGSYSDMRGYNLALGFAKAIQNNAGKLTYGPLLEYGWGNYTSHLDSGIRADGNTKYYGIGMIVRQDNNSGLYYEGSVRYGRMDSDYASGDMIGAGGSKVYADYDSSSSYYGAHVGIGKIKKLNETTKADIYAKLLYTHQSGDSVTLGGEGNGEVYDFDAVNSTRARIGARLSKDVNANGTCYAGLAYEYEFDGEATATVKGLSTPSPSIKGSSGMLELGYIIQNKDVNAPAVDIGLQGWSGKKQGFSGNINFIWKF